MKQWYAKELSQLVDVSVRTLHYYDKIDLLKPSIRLDNNYRLYSEKDLLRLQRIVALKFFGFELSQIKTLLSDDNQVMQHLTLQSELIDKKVNGLLHAQSLLKQLIQDCEQTESIPWNKTVEMIEVFKMTEQLEDSWVKEIFNKEELKQYAEFEAKMKSSHKKKDFEQRWQALVKELNGSLSLDPKSPEGIAMGERFMQWVNGLYGKEYAHLRTKKMEQGFGEGLGLDDSGFTKENLGWLEKAIDAYWRHRIYSLLDKVSDETSNDALLEPWHEIMDDMYGNEEARKVELVHVALAEEKISDIAKSWLKGIYGIA